MPLGVVGWFLVGDVVDGRLVCGECVEFWLDWDWCPSVEGEWMGGRSMGVVDWMIADDCVVGLPLCGRVGWRWSEWVLDDEVWIYCSVVVVVRSRSRMMVGCEECGVWMSGWHGYVVAGVVW